MKVDPNSEEGFEEFFNLFKAYTALGKSIFETNVKMYKEKEVTEVQ